MKKRVYWIIPVICLAGVLPSPVQAAGWSKINEHDGIVVYERQVPGTDLVEFMGVTVLNYKMEIIGEVLRDVSSHPLWVTDCTGAQIRKKYDRNTFITHMVLSPPIINDRDVVIKNTTVYDFDRGRAVVSFACSNEVNIPIMEGRTRITVMNGSFEMEYLGRDKTKFIYRLAVDPGGNIPKKLAYAVMKRFPHDTLRKLKTVINHNKYAVAVKGTYEEKRINLLATDETAVKKVLLVRLARFVREKNEFTALINFDRTGPANITASGGSYESIEKATFDLFFGYFGLTIKNKYILDKLRNDSELVAEITTLIMYSCDATNTSVDKILERYINKYTE